MGGGGDDFLGMTAPARLKTSYQAQRPSWNKENEPRPITASSPFTSTVMKMGVDYSLKNENHKTPAMRQFRSPSPFLGPTKIEHLKEEMAINQYRAGLPSRTDSEQSVPAPNSLVRFSSPVPTSSHRLDFGTYGSNPRNKLPHVRKDFSDTASCVDLFQGTPKGRTKHIPGYQGFVPSSDNSPAAIAHGGGLYKRPHAKNILLNTYYHNMPGYGGYLPLSVVNEKGTRQAATETVYGRDFVPLPLPKPKPEGTGPKKDAWGREVVKRQGFMYDRPSRVVHNMLLSEKGKSILVTASTMDY